MITWREALDSVNEIFYTTDDINAEVFVYMDQLKLDSNEEDGDYFLPWQFRLQWDHCNVHFDVYSHMGFKTKEAAIEFVETVVRLHKLEKER